MEDSLKLRRLGKSELLVSPIGLGCWQFSKGKGMIGKFWPNIPDEVITEIVKVSIEGGVNWFDTAEVYGWGESEKALTRALKNLEKKYGDVIIATKWSPTFRTSSSITKTIDTRLEMLDGYRIDLYQVHHPYSFSSVKDEMSAMAKLIKEKKIRYIGVSNFSAEKMKIAKAELAKYDIDLISNQVVYNLLNRKIETNSILETAKGLDISIIAYSPLAQGLLTGKIHENPEIIKIKPGIRKHQKAFKQKGLAKSLPVIDLVKELAGKYNVTPAQVALNWLINFHGDIVVAIPGATKVHQAKDNAGTMNFRLTIEEMQKLSEASSLFRN